MIEAQFRAESGEARRPPTRTANRNKRSAVCAFGPQRRPVSDRTARSTWRHRRLVSNTGTAEPAEIASPLALGSISAIVFFVDDDGQTGVVSAVARAPEVSDRDSNASLAIRQFTVERRQGAGRFLYRPTLTLAETSGRSRARIRKIAFELLDVGGASQAPPVWNVPDVPAGGTISLATGSGAQAPWFEIERSGDASRVSVAISFVDDAGHGGLVSASALVQRQNRQ